MPKGVLYNTPFFVNACFYTLGFCVFLPTVNKKDEKPSIMSKRKILIIDDNCTDLKIFKALLNGDYDCRCLNKSTDFEKNIERFDPEILIVDILMPEKDGYEVLEEVKEKYPDLYVVACTAGATLHRDVYLEAAKALGADAVLEKPLKKDKLHQVLDKLGQVAK